MMAFPLAHLLALPAAHATMATDCLVCLAFSFVVMSEIVCL